MDLLENPFHILTATPRDNRRRIIELADERSLLLDSNECMQARSDLTNPRKRLTAEIAWLPGIGPKRADEALKLIESSDGHYLLTMGNLTTVARANLLAAGLSRLPEYSANDAAKWILTIAWAFENITPEEIVAIVNEERIVSGFPEVTDLSAVETEIQERRLYYRQVIKTALDNLPARELVEAVTIAVASATDNGEKQGPILISDLVDSYEVEAQKFLEKEEENISFLVEKLRAAVDTERPDSALAPMVNQLIQVVKNWDTIAQPIQVSAKSRGLDHDASHRVASLVRGLALDMFNEHAKLDFTQQLTNMLQEVFAEVGKVAERTAEDANVLEEIAERRKLSHLLDPISELCKIALENSGKKPASANDDAQKVINAAPRLILSLEASNPAADILSQGKDEIAITLMHCAIVYGNSTENWKPCILFLEEALKYGSSQEVNTRIQKNLETVRNNDRHNELKPISSAPSLYTLNGIGFKLYGATDHDGETRSHLSTYYFVVFFIPIFPIRRYRVIDNIGVYRFLGKAPLRTFDKWHIAITIGIAAWMFLNVQ